MRLFCNISMKRTTCMERRRGLRRQDLGARRGVAELRRQGLGKERRRGVAKLDKPGLGTEYRRGVARRKRVQLAKRIEPNIICDKEKNAHNHPLLYNLVVWRSA